MAHAENLPDNVLDAIAEQIGTLLPGVSDTSRLHGSRIEMGETFELWALGADAVTQPTNDISQLANPTGRWHHQVTFDGVAESFARSTPLGTQPDSWRVTEFFESQLAGKIDESVAWIDQNVPDDMVVRLLVVPAYRLHAFWLFDASNSLVFVIDCPSQFSYLRPGQLLSQDDFLEALRKEQYIVGRFRS